MKRIETIAAEFPNVGVRLSDQAQALRGQLASIGFTCQDADKSDGLNWLVVDSQSRELEASHPGLPVLHTGSKVSIYGLKQAILALFNQAA
ncbi:MAG: hypothetical protein K2X44_08580 [Magnetospirillum sp.]|nr:hypothetical protein [Magnetospirillum sp.]